MRGSCGQSTLEYALVLIAFLAMASACGLIWHAAQDGALTRLAADAASHATGPSLISTLQDVMGF